MYSRVVVQQDSPGYAGNLSSRLEIHMTLTLIVALSVSLVVAAIYFGMRKRATSVELGSMSNQWVAEQKSNEHTYSGR